MARFRAIPLTSIIGSVYQLRLQDDRELSELKAAIDNRDVSLARSSKD